MVFVFLRDWFFVLLVFSLISVHSKAEETAESPHASDEILYYDLERSLGASAGIETRLSLGLDYSNPYFNSYALNVGALYVWGPWLSTGIEVSGFLSEKRPSTQALEDELKDYGYKLQGLYPVWAPAAVLRFSPMNGLINWFSNRVLIADIGVLVRAGGVQYNAGNWSPVFGTGLEVYLGLSPSIGFTGSLIWDAERPSSNVWQSRVGFRFGTAIRFGGLSG